MKYSLVIAAVLLCGCYVYRPDDGGGKPDKPDKPVVPVGVKRADLCEMLAAHIDSGHIDTSDELVRVFQLLQDNGKWTTADSAAVDEALPGLPTAKRALTKDDAAKLRGVK